MAVTTITTTAAEDARLTAWATALGFATPKACVIALVRQAVQQYETAQSYQQNAQAFTAGYVPINPT